MKTLEPFKQHKYFDIHDKDVTAEIYLYLFASMELQGNDLVYKIYTEDFFGEDLNDAECDARMEALWQKQIKRGANNCYYDNESMVKLVANPCTFKDASKMFKEWCKAKGITEEDEFLLVKIWW